jgi:hypothetical protein
MAGGASEKNEIHALEKVLDDLAQQNNSAGED